MKYRPWQQQYSPKRRAIQQLAPQQQQQQVLAVGWMRWAPRRQAALHVTLLLLQQQHDTALAGL
jgi:hypothetical protein